MFQAFYDAFFAYGHARTENRALECMLYFLYRLAIVLRVAGVFFGDDYAAFLLYRFGREDYGVAIVSEKHHAVVNQLLLKPAACRFIDCFGEARMRVCVSAEGHSQSLEIFDHISRGKMFCPVEGHMFGKVRNSAFVFVFIGRSALYEQAHRHPVGRFGIFEYGNGHSVGKRFDNEVFIPFKDWRGERNM